MKCLIYQVSILGRNNTKYEHCLNSVKKYCKKYNIDHIIQTSPILKIVPQNKNATRFRTQPNHIKLPIHTYGYLVAYEKGNAFSYFDEYDKICIIDADISIHEDSPNIFNEIQDEEFAGCVPRYSPLKLDHIKKSIIHSREQYSMFINDIFSEWDHLGVQYYNTGVMLFTKEIRKYFYGKDIKQFFYSKENEIFINGNGNLNKESDQTLWNYWLKKNNVKQKILDWKWNVVHGSVKEKYLSEAYFVHFTELDYMPRKGNEIPYIMKNIRK